MRFSGTVEKRNTGMSPCPLYSTSHCVHCNQPIILNFHSCLHNCCRDALKQGSQPCCSNEAVHLTVDCGLTGKLPGVLCVFHRWIRAYRRKPWCALQWLHGHLLLYSHCFPSTAVLLLTLSRALPPCVCVCVTFCAALSGRKLWGILKHEL